MAVYVHAGSRTYTLADGVDTPTVAQDIQDAVDAKGYVKLLAQINGAELTVWVNTTTVDTIVLDPNGVAVGFFHG
jgi:hypothetical protein